MGSAPYESVGGRSKKPKPSADIPVTTQVAQDNKAKAAPIEAAGPVTGKGEGTRGDQPEPPLRTIEVTFTASSHAIRTFSSRTSTSSYHQPLMMDSKDRRMKTMILDMLTKRDQFSSISHSEEP